MLYTEMAIISVLLWAGAALILDAVLPRRPTLSERLRPYQPSVGDEAETWLHHQNRDR